MPKGAPDYTKMTLLQALDGSGALIPVLLDSSGKIISVLQGIDSTSVLRTLKVDSAGQIVVLIKGSAGEDIAVDASGFLGALMKGTYGDVLKTLAVDADGRILARLQGKYGETMLDVAVDAGGKLAITEISQQNVSKDETEAQTWDTPVATLLSNLNRIRNQIIAITGEAWGTVSHSIAAVWAKFHATTGHTHTGAADNAPQISHTAALTNVGTNTHVQIDTHISATASVHGVSASGFEDGANKGAASGYAGLNAAAELTQLDPMTQKYLSIAFGLGG